MHIIQGENHLIGFQKIQNLKRDSSILSEEEKKELEQISFEARRESWWKAREILFQLAKNLKIEYQGLRKGDNGKPHFLKGSDYHCSLSHSSTYAAAMISKASCGIDIEQVHPKVNRIFGKFSSSEELFGRNGTRFRTSIWACKESIYKALDTPGIHFREQIRLKGWQKNDSQIDFEFYAPDAISEKFSCEVRWFEDQVLAYTLEKDT